MRLRWSDNANDAIEFQAGDLSEFLARAPSALSRFRRVRPRGLAMLQLHCGEAWVEMSPNPLGAACDGDDLSFRTMEKLFGAVRRTAEWAAALGRLVEEIGEELGWHARQ